MSQLGYWLVEALVDHTSGETFPRNGLKALVCVANTSCPDTYHLPVRNAVFVISRKPVSLSSLTTTLPLVVKPHIKLLRDSA